MIGDINMPIIDKKELREIRKKKLPSVTAFSSRNSLSVLSSPLGLPKEFAQMETAKGNSP